MPSIGEAISLQGRSGIAEQLGKLQYQRGLAAEKAQAAATAKTAKEITLPTGKYNRLVAPMVIKAYDKAQERIANLDRSNPSWQNELPLIAADFKREMIDLDSKNLTANAIDAQTQSIDKNNIFFTNNLMKGLEIWNSSKDLDEVEQRRKNLNLSDDPYVKFHGDGTFDFTGSKKIDVEKELESEAQKLTSLISAEYNSGTSLGNVKTTTAKQRPWDINAANRAYSKNPSMYPEGRPASIEDLVLAYMKNSPEAVYQFAERKKIPVKMDPTSGQLSEESGKAIKDAMMNHLIEFKNPNVSSKVERAPTRISMGDDNQRDIFESTKQRTTITPSATNPNVSYTSIDNMGFSVENLDISNQKNLIDTEGRPVTKGVKTDNTAAEIRVMPYGYAKPEKGKEKEKGRLLLLKDNQFKTATGRVAIQGFEPFIMFGQPGQQYFLPLRDFSYDAFIKDKAKTRNIKEVVADMKIRTEKGNDALKKALNRGVQDPNELINIFEQAYKQ